MVPDQDVICMRGGALSFYCIAVSAASCLMEVEGDTLQTTIFPQYNPQLVFFHVHLTSGLYFRAQLSELVN